MRRRQCTWAARARLTVLAALTVGFAACDDNPTAPIGGENFDAQAAQGGLDQMDGFLSSPAWASYEALSKKIGGNGIVASRIPTLETEGLPIVGDATNRLLGAASRIPLISTGNLGNTFVIDPTSGEYANDPARTGAPANGVRFILYELIEGTEDPDLGNEIGHLQLVDNGASSSGIDLQLTAVANGLTFVSYGLAVAGDETAGSVHIDGFVADDADQLDFTFDVAATDNGTETTVDLDATLAVDSENFSVTVAADGSGLSEQGESLTARVDVMYGAESLSIDVAGNDQAIDATFRINGAVLATATGDPNDPQIVGAEGMELTGPEIVVLMHIVETSDDIFRFFEDLVEPAEGIILLAVIL